MTFLKFSNEIAKKVKQALVDASVSIETIKKPYGNLVGLAVSKQGSDTMPLFHLEPMYKAFRDGMSMDSLVAEIALQTNRFCQLLGVKDPELARFPINASLYQSDGQALFWAQL